MLLFSTLFDNRVHVDLGSGVSIPIAPSSGKATLLKKKKPKNKNYPDAPEPVTITEVDGVQIKVERLPLRYEALDDVMEDLPDFVQDLLRDRNSNV